MLYCHWRDWDSGGEHALDPFFEKKSLSSYHFDGVKVSTQNYVLRYGWRARRGLKIFLLPLLLWLMVLRNLTMKAKAAWYITGLTSIVWGDYKLIHNMLNYLFKNLKVNLSDSFMSSSSSSITGILARYALTRRTIFEK